MKDNDKYLIDTQLKDCNQTTGVRNNKLAKRVLSGFSVSLYEKNKTNFLANPIFSRRYNRHISMSSKVNKKKKRDKERELLK